MINKNYGISITLYANYDYNEEDYRKAYLDWLVEWANMGEDDGTEFDEGKFQDWLYDELGFQWDVFNDNLSRSRFLERPCVVYGTLGLWNRTASICQAFNTIEDAIHKCITDCDYVIIKQENGKIKVKGYHHDGENNFEIALLNKKGIRAKERIEEGWGKADLSNKTYHKKLDDYLV